MLAHYLHLGIIDYWNEIGFSGIQQQKQWRILGVQKVY